MKFSSQLVGLSSLALSIPLAYAQAPEVPAAPPIPGLANAQQQPLVDPNTPIPNNIEAPVLNGEGVAQFYTEWTGKRVILSKASKALEISFVQNAPLTYGEAAALLEKTCFLEGLVFVPSGPNEVKLLPAPNVRNAGGYRFISDALLLPEGEELVTYVMSFDYIKPEDAMSIFTGVIAQVSAHGAIVPVPNANSLLITENSQLIRTLISIKERIDIPQDLATQKWVTVYNADAETTAESVRTIMDFSAQQNTQLTAGRGRAAAPVTNTNGSARRGNNNANRNQNQRAANTSSTSTTSASSVQVMADARTNRVFLIGRPIDVEVAEGLIQGFDQPLDKRTYFKHRLEFLSVADFLSVAQNAINLATTKTGEVEGTSGARTGTTRPTNRGGGRNNANGSFSQNNTGGTLSGSGRAEGPEAVIIGKTLLVADNSNNTLIVQGPPQSIRVVQDLIEEMDQSPEQIQITAVFGRYNLGDAVDFGVDWAKT